MLDKLQQEEVISADEQEEILTRGVKKDQNARLLFLLKRINASKQPFESFVKVLDTNYGFIATELRKSYAEFRTAGNFDVQVKCFCCQLIDNLIPNNVSHYLYEEGLISHDDDLEEINNYNIPRKDRVRKLFKLLNKHPDKLAVAEKLCQSLQPKYSYILKRLGTSGICFQCQCMRTDRCLSQIVKGRSSEKSNRPKEKLKINSEQKPNKAFNELSQLKYISKGSVVNKNESRIEYGIAVQTGDRKVSADDTDLLVSDTQNDGVGTEDSLALSSIQHSEQVYDQDKFDHEPLMSKDIGRRLTPYPFTKVVSKTLPNDRNL